MYLIHFLVAETALTMIGKYGITASLAVLVLYAGEIYPTTLRNEGLGLASTAGRIGGMVAPFSVYLVSILVSCGCVQHQSENCLII